VRMDDINAVSQVAMSKVRSILERLVETDGD